MTAYKWKKNLMFVLITCFVFVAVFSACGRRLDHSVQDLSELFQKNETLFREATEVLGDECCALPGALILPPDSTEKELDGFERSIVKKMDGSIFTARSELSAEAYDEIDRAVAPLFSDLHIECISMVDNSVRFTIESHSGLTAKIVYAPDRDESKINLGFEITEIQEIEPCWYGALTSD